MLDLPVGAEVDVALVLDALVLDDDLRLPERVEDLSVQQLVPQTGIEALDVAVLPR